MIKMIFAVGPNGEFGKADGLPWDAPGDLQHFKEYTKGCTLVMSCATFASLPCKLPGRIHYVVGDSISLAKNGDEPDFKIPLGVPTKRICDTINDYSYVDVVVIGGRKMLMDASKFCDAACITEIDESYVGDADYFIESGTLYDNLNNNITYLGGTYIGDHCVQEWSNKPIVEEL